MSSPVPQPAVLAKPGVSPSGVLPGKKWFQKSNFSEHVPLETSSSVYPKGLYPRHQALADCAPKSGILCY